MEDDLKISNVNYLSNHWLYPPQILNLSSGDKIKIKNAWNEEDLQWKTTSEYLNGRWPKNEEKVEFIESQNQEEILIEENKIFDKNASQKKKSPGIF